MALVACSRSDKLIYQDESAPVDDRVEDLLQRMTLEEKVAQTIFVWQMLGAEGAFSADSAQKYAPHGLGGLHRRYLEHSHREAAAEMNEIQRYFIEHTRLGIPVLMNTEGLHGVMGRNMTVFPAAIGLGSTWDQELFTRIYSAVALEARCLGIHQFFSPNLDIVRDPRWGRTDENFGEDPFLTSRLGVAFIKAVQGDGILIDDRHVAATAKHYAVHGQPVGGINTAPGNISRGEILNYFLPPFEAAVREAGVKLVMATYNEVDGIPIPAHQWLLQDVLRNRFGFTGVTMSDYHSITRMISDHFTAADRTDAAFKAMTSGVDVELCEPPRYTYPTLVEQVRQGIIPEKILDESVTRILRLKLETGLFDDPYVDVEKVDEIIHNEHHRAIALEAARKSIVLLKNENHILPLDKERINTIAVIGPNADTYQFGNYSGTSDRATTVLDGLVTEFGAGRVRFARGCHLTRKTAPGSPRDVEPWPREDNLRLIEEAVRVAETCDVIILAIGSNTDLCREAGWANTTGDRSSLTLVGEQNELVEAMLGTSRPVIVLLFNGRPLSFTRVKEKVPAILECWQSGEATGKAVTDILVGRVNPGGKLPITFPASVGHIPSYYNRKPTARVRYLIDTREYLYPFGYGLSYTRYEYTDLKVEPASIKTGEKAMAELTVSNTGKMKGEEIVQLYIRDQVSSVTRPVKELKGFQRISLESGESKTVQFEVTPDKLGFYNRELEKVVEPGEFLIMAGPNSVELDTAILSVTD